MQFGYLMQFTQVLQFVIKRHVWYINKCRPERQHESTKSKTLRRNVVKNSSCFSDKCLLYYKSCRWWGANEMNEVDLWKLNNEWVLKWELIFSSVTDWAKALSNKASKLYWRVWSWLRTNAGGVPNTCKSSGLDGVLALLRVSGGRVSNT